MRKKSILNMIFTTILACSCVFTSIGCGGCKDKTPVDSTVNEPEIIEPLQEAKDAVSGETLMLVEGRKTKYKVVYSTNSTAVETYAADFLVDTLKSATGANLIKVRDSAISAFNANDYCIYVGTTSQFTQADIAFDAGTLGDDGFVIENQGNSVFIRGGGEMGNLYGVQEFLRYEIAFEAYAADEIYYNRVTTVAMLDFKSMNVIPSFAYRRLSAPSIADTSEGALMRTYVTDNGSTLAGNIWSGTLQYHSIARLISGNPGWINNGQVCLSNPDAREYIAQKVAEIILNETPSTKYFELGNADNDQACNCKDCIASSLENGGMGGVYIIWMNAVAARIQEIYAAKGIDREFYLVALCYLAYAAPPTVFNEETQKYEPVNENVICREDVAVRFGTIHACSTHAFNDSNCKVNVEAGLAGQCESWATIAEKSKFMLYMYGTEFNDFFFFYNDITSIAGNAKYLKEIGASDLYIQTEFNPNNPFGHLRAYLRAKLWWDASLDINELINNFFYNYYKEAAPYMLEYFNAIQANFVYIGYLMKNGGCMGYHGIGGNYMQSKYWSYELMQSYERTVEKAYKAIENAGYSVEEQEKIRRRILADEMFIQNIYVQWHSAKFADAAELRANFLANNALLGNSHQAEYAVLK